MIRLHAQVARRVRDTLRNRSPYRHTDDEIAAAIARVAATYTPAKSRSRRRKMLARLALQELLP